jgi:quercetin dioxygenase-like cupin family protein
VHEHPYQRYASVLAGHLTVTLPDSGRSFAYGPGDFIVEVRDLWHYGVADRPDQVVPLVIDQVEAGHANTVLRPPP